MTPLDTTLDGILNHRVMLEQPAQGYRIAVDTVLLAAAVPALAGDHVLDMGCGVGGALLALAARVQGITGLGIDIQPDLVELYRRNITRNLFATGLQAQEGDVAHLPANLHGRFDHVLANPPYHEEKRHDASGNDIKRIAHIEKPGDLALWIASAAAMLKPSGMLVLIHRADRRVDILKALQGHFGEVEILPLLPKQGGEAKRIIIRARKDAVPSVREMQPLVLHEAEGNYTAAADAVLRDAQPLRFMTAELPSGSAV